MRAESFIVSCEHGGNRVPAAYAPLFKGKGTLLRSHRGFDGGALLAAREIAAALGAPLFAATTTRLLVDLNRSRGHPALYSECTRGLPREEREALLARWYLPHRQRIEAEVARHIEAGRRVAHVASHSFTPLLHGEERRADIGLLYDPARPTESAFCAHWRTLLLRRAPHLVVRRNYPYRGNADGLTAHLRKRFDDGEYLGVELEINQKHAAAGGRAWRQLRHLLAETLVLLRDERAHRGRYSQPERLKR